MGGISVIILFSIFGVIFGFFIAAFFVLIAYFIYIYVFESISIMKIMKNKNDKLYLTSWIPIYNKYLLGKIASAKTLGIILAIIDFIIFIIFVLFNFIFEYNLFLFLIFLLLVILSFILNVVISHKIFKKATNKYGDIFTILVVFSLGILRPVFIFLLRDNKKIFE